MHVRPGRADMVVAKALVRGLQAPRVLQRMLTCLVHVSKAPYSALVMVVLLPEARIDIDAQLRPHCQGMVSDLGQEAR